MHAGLVAVDDLLAVDGRVATTRVGVAGDDDAHGADVAAAVEFVPAGGGERPEVDVGGRDQVLLAHATVDLDGREWVLEGTGYLLQQGAMVRGQPEGERVAFERAHGVAEEGDLTVADVFEEHGRAVRLIAARP